MKTQNILLASVLLFFFSALSAQDTLIIVDKMPRFPGGERALAIYWDQHFFIKQKKSSKLPQGEGQIAFTIDTSGIIRNVYLKQSLSPEYDQKALEVVKNMPAWEPAIVNGRKVSMTISHTFFVVARDSDGNIIINADEVNHLVPERGSTFGLWAGTMIHSKDYGEYFNPARFILGIHFGYSFKKASVGFEYDVFNISKVRKPFVVDNRLFSPDLHRFSSFTLYFPVSFRLAATQKWKVSAYASPVLNAATINLRKSNDSDAFNYAWWSWGAGLYIDKSIGRDASVNRRGTTKILDTYLRTRIFVSPMHFAKNNSTEMSGTAVTLSFGMHGVFRKLKKSKD